MTKEEMNSDIDDLVNAGGEILHDQTDDQDFRILVILRDVEGLDFLYNFLSAVITVAGTGEIPPVTKIPKGGGV